MNIIDKSPGDTLYAKLLDAVGINRIQATAPLTGQAFEVFFLRGCISLKNRS
jgi:hypothetical protein